MNSKSLYTSFHQNQSHCANQGIAKHYTVFECASCVFGARLEVDFRAQCIDTGARRTQNHPSVQIFNRCDAYNGHGALGFACNTHPHRAKTVPNHLKFFVKPLKLTGRLYDMTCSSKFINDMVVYGYV